MPKEKALTALRQTNRIIFTSGDRTELSVTDPPNFRSDTAVLGDDAGNVASLGCRADVFGGMADDGASGEAEQQDYNLENPTRAHPGAESPLCPYALPGTHAAYGFTPCPVLRYYMVLRQAKHNIIVTGCILDRFWASLKPGASSKTKTHLCSTLCTRKSLICI